MQPLVWTEGTVLSQQHFQQWQAQQHEQSRRDLLQNPDAWGLISLSCRETALLSGIFVLEKCQARFPDGCYIDFANVDEPLCLTLSPHASAIYLCLPKNNVIRGVNGYPCDSTHPAWQVSYHTIKDRYDATRTHEVAFAVPCLYLTEKREEHRDVAHIQIARVIRDERGQFSFDAHFIASLMSIAHAPQLINSLRQLHDIFIAKISLLSNQALTDANKLAPLLITANTLHTVIAHPHLTPIALYQLLSQQFLSLAALDYQQDLTKIPEFNFLDLSHVFSSLLSLIETKIHQVCYESHNIIVLKKMNTHLFVSESTPLISEKSKLLLVVANLDKLNTSLEKFMAHIKISERSAIKNLIASALPGVKIHYTSAPPRHIFKNHGHDFFEIEHSGGCWRDIVAKQNIAIYVPAEYGHISLSLLLLEN